MPEHIIEHKCHKCGGIDEACFSISGPHVKQTCLHCGCYVCFFDKSKLPDIRDVRLRIWVASNNDPKIIEEAKERIAFHTYDPDGNYSNTWPYKILQLLQYWKLYIKVRSLAP